MEGHRELLAGITGRHGIPGSVLVAVWGESNYGANQGGFPVIRAMVTLAYDKRRAAMFRREFLHALRILDQGHIALAVMRGSWADAMGQVQFMPSTFVDFARDGDGDGRKDIWQSRQTRWNRLLASWHRPGSPDTSGAGRSRYLPDSIGASRDSIR